MRRARFMALLLIVGLFFSLTACGKVSEKIAEKGVEKLVENQTGAKVDITKDGAKIQSEGQTMQVGEKLAWPKDAMGEVPEPKAQVTFVMNAGDKKGCTVAVSGLSNDDAKSYIAKLKEMGYKEIMTMQDKDAMMFAGEKDKVNVTFTYNISSKEAQISNTPKAE